MTQVKQKNKRHNNILVRKNLITDKLYSKKDETIPKVSQFLVV